MLLKAEITLTMAGLPVHQSPHPTRPQYYTLVTNGLLWPPTLSCRQTNQSPKPLFVLAFQTCLKPSGTQFPNPLSALPTADKGAESAFDGGEDHSTVILKMLPSFSEKIVIKRE